MANTRGVFTLQEVKYALEDGEWILPDQAFVSDITSTPNVSYWAGGTTPSEVSSIDKLTFDNDTTALLPGSNLTAVRSTHGGFSSKNSGYFLGGRTPLVSSVDKLSYQSESVSKSPASNLNQVIQDARGTASETHGYSTGGYNGSSYVSTVNKLIFAVDTSFQSPSASLITQRNVHGALGNQTYCYLTNGYDSTGYINSCDRIVFGTDTTSRIPATFAGSRGGVTGASTDTIGYISGGVEPGPTFYSTVNKFTFSTESTSILPSTNSLPASVQYNGGSSTPSLGYFGGGKGSGSAITTMCKINSSDDTRSNVPGANLTATRYNFSAVTPRGFSRATTGYVASTQNLKGASSPGFGYWAGGGPTSQVVKHTFSSDSAARVPNANLNVSSYAQAAMSSGNNFYVAAGGNPAKSSTEKVSYASDTATLIPGANVSQERRILMGVGNKDKGYAVGGGIAGTNYSVVDRITYSTETSVRIPAANLLAAPAGVGVAAGAGTPGFGFIAGGFSAALPGRISSFDRIDYTTETTSRSPSTNLPQANGNLTGTGNGYAGYRGGGEVPSSISNISRHVYATDSVSYLTNSLPSGAQTNFESNGSGVSAYWGGNVSDLDKMSYSTETGYTIPASGVDKGYASAASTEEFDMPQPRPETPTLNSSIPGSTSNAGYFGGGALSPGTTNEIDKVDFSTDVTSTIPGTLSLSRYATGASSSPTAGYFGGGEPGPRSTMDKVTYSTDTASPVPGANLSLARYYVNGMGNSEKGFWGGGYNSGEKSTTDKCTYSSDTTAVVPGAALYAARYGVGGAANSNYGYFGGGSKPGPTRYSSTDRIVFSTDTASILPSANLTDSKGYMGAAGNPAKAYFIGGSLLPAAGSTTQAEKLTYSTETYSLVTSANAPGPQRGSFLSATGNDGTGYFGAGLLLPASTAGSSVFKVNYSTETSLSSPSSFFPTGRWARSATSARENSISATSNIL